MQLELARAKAGAYGDHFVRQVDLFDFARHQIGAAAKSADRRNDVGQADGAGDYFREHGLIDPIVLAIHQRDVGLFGPQKLFEIAGGVDAGESAAQDDDLFPVRAHFGIVTKCNRTIGIFALFRKNALGCIL